MPGHMIPPRQVPKDDDGYFEQMTKAIFRSGFSWKVIENKWPHFVEAFDRFSVERVAAYNVDDIERLLSDEGIVRKNEVIIRTQQHVEDCLGVFLFQDFEEGSRNQDVADPILPNKEEFAAVVIDSTAQRSSRSTEQTQQSYEKASERYFKTFHRSFHRFRRFSQTPEKQIADCKVVGRALLHWQEGPRVFPAPQSTHVREQRSDRSGVSWKADEQSRRKFFLA